MFVKVFELTTLIYSLIVRNIKRDRITEIYLFYVNYIYSLFQFIIIFQLYYYKLLQEGGICL